jgi:hypothetical protein
LKLLSKNAFEKAADFIAGNARPLEKAQFDLHFGAGSVEDVLTELVKFQNDDGGFGHAVEPDVRMPSSSPFITSVAFQVLTELDVSAGHPMVRDGIAYFERSYADSIGGWDPTGPKVDEHPRAPWWNYSTVEGRLDPIKQSNPGAEIVGYLHRYQEVTSEGFVAAATLDAMQTFEELPEDMEVHSMMCFMRLAELGPSSVREQLLPKLRRGVRLVVGTSAAEWAAYGGRPLWFAGSPDCLLANELVDSIQIQQDYEIDTQTKDGSWMPNWAWGQYEDVWEKAKLEWAGYLTLRNLLALRAWGRL